MRLPSRALRGLFPTALGVVVALGGDTVLAAPGAGSFRESVIWARNIGGPMIETRAGERFSADPCGDRPGSGDCHSVERVLRTQDEVLFQSYRSGDQCFEVPLPVGRYDLGLFFTEPRGRAGARRVFDVEVEGRQILRNLSLDEKPAGEAHFAISRSFAGIGVADGELNLCLASRVGEAVISGVMVRRSAFSTAGWKQVWGDEFDDPDSLHDNWTAEEWKPGRVNGEEQAYTRDRRNVRVEDGILILEAHATGADSPRYTSGRIHSWGHQAFRYGRLDIRARVPEGRGVWPALWLLPDDPYRYATTCFSDKREWLADEDCDAWPNSGEIDLMEHVGYEPGVVHGTVHSRDFYARTGNQVQGSVVVPDLGAAFHTYSLVWEEGALAMYIDGMRYFAYFNDGEGNGQWPFDHAFHIVMNLAIGGDWSGSYGPVEEGIMPRRLEVDFVRLYRRTADPARRTVHGGADTGIASAAWSPALSRPRSPLSHNRCAGPGQQ